MMMQIPMHGYRSRVKSYLFTALALRADLAYSEFGVAQYVSSLCDTSQRAAIAKSGVRI